MKNWKVLWAIIAILLLVVGVLTFSLIKTRIAAIDSFESCAAAGYSIMESYPPQCMTPDGRGFTQDITSVKPEPPQGPDPDQIACTQEAKLCPDGSSVGRTGPNCEFAPCPGEN